MQEVRYDGSEKLTPQATLEQMEAAMEKAENMSVAMHKPGATFQSKGKRYVVQADGSLTSLAKAKKKRRAKGKRAKKSRRRNRR